jgi:hypothetical protein
MDTQAIGTVFAGSAVLTIVAFWLHRRLAGSAGRPGGASMAAFVLAWLSALAAFLTGTFLLIMAVSR